MLDHALEAVAMILSLPKGVLPGQPFRCPFFIIQESIDILFVICHDI
jgi:hypothetical protein